MAQNGSLVSATTNFRVHERMWKEKISFRNFTNARYPTNARAPFTDMCGSGIYDDTHVSDVMTIRQAIEQSNPTSLMLP